ncbi:hypothetical protein A2276_07175 [candidate division WOR-1 bacterium RIFOXYA12_FULL_43_27]|uniref:Shikimate kinase n=1 Tax=candidate division WOR-1 bacterium RIFOXYC2_FULL_46_14 TaxID=1802587 RepID=A0A1F4U5T0_UNCSA|nr:MAG: hypothetical protein A2276_07175 [candidate division WOR-1 bacterium RIFOXYA12_FULL_43_27]OGC20391.1 MAG: hypothetical protein A2292_05000 [candidate division WOR-1 bacterium RIFOXYB2_FULL_46_45]OGC31872.1 MAG: hypothetical protein A2232_06450 [candidate division WOR-1 bacterium RIFOXYA2_FULL_46_56]OGC40237.1 MAG: hypothetical protein A2438_03020 [candidate division WOR-1 bacterium RIFOXYC2_FULL_46_14]
MNIILIGFMGSGKSAVGQKLAERLSMQFLDTDPLIEKTEKMMIPDIFEKKGEKYFRDLETEVVKTLQDYDNFVVATGGGMILRDENVTMLKRLGPLILLWVDEETVFKRLEQTNNRPLLRRDLLEQRKPAYEKAADFKIDTTALSVDQVVEEIVKWIKK